MANEVDSRGKQGIRDNQGNFLTAEKDVEQESISIEDIEEQADKAAQLDGLEADDVLSLILEEVEALGKDIDPILAGRYLTAYRKIKEAQLDNDPAESGRNAPVPKAPTII
jgi:hypothetical protein